MSLVDCINTEADQPHEAAKKKRIQALCEKLLRNKLDHLSQEERQILEPVLLKYTHGLHDDETNDLKGTDIIEHQILVGDAQPIRRPQHPTPFALRDESVFSKTAEEHFQRLETVLERLDKANLPESTNSHDPE